ncbi:ABC transporter permease [Candidatus Acetothermia bacterium]|nr:ABC transporter permease [Candidatus Acetothermia bacterium]MBI3642762.1 ABC transporter permease [Candidatus Acetothermia bacterium]
MIFRKRVELFLRTVIGRAYPRLIGLQRERSWLIFDTLLPLLQMSAFVFVYRAMQAPPEYTGFVVLGGAMTAYWLNVLWSMATQLHWEKENGNLALFIMAPTSRMAILLGMALGGIVATSFRAAAVVLVGIFIFGAHFSAERIPELIGIFLLTLIALYGMGMLFSSLFLLYGREAWHMSLLLQEPIYLLSGFYFPVRSLGYWTAMGASIVPITLGLDAMRQLLFPRMMQQIKFLDVRIELLVLAVLGLVFLFLAQRSLSYMERLACQEGRLTVRGQ